MPETQLFWFSLQIIISDEIIIIDVPIKKFGVSISLKNVTLTIIPIETEIYLNGANKLTGATLWLWANHICWRPDTKPIIISINKRSEDRSHWIPFKIQIRKKVIAPEIFYHKAILVEWSVWPSFPTKTNISAPKNGQGRPKIIPMLNHPPFLGLSIKIIPMKPIRPIARLNQPTTSFINIGAKIVTKRGIVCNKVVIRLRSINWSAADNVPNVARPVMVRMARPIAELIWKMSRPRWIIAKKVRAE